MIDVSVIILNYNTFELTCACIKSIYAFTENVTFEIVLVDNGSSECKPSLFSTYFPKIILVESESNLGFAKGNNLGISYARGKTVLLLNSDTELLNNAIYLAYNRLMLSETVGALTGKILTPNREVQHVAQRHPSISLLSLQVFRLFHLMPKKRRAEVFLGEYFHYENEVYADWIWATFFLIRKETLNLFPQGKLPEDFFMYEEDKLWCYILRKKGYKLLFTPAPLVLHHVSGSSRQEKSIVAKNRLILSNEFQVITITKGRLYAKLYFLLKALQYFMSNYEHSRLFANLYFKIAFTGRSYFKVFVPKSS